MKQQGLIFIFFSTLLSVGAQDAFISEYPEGLYETKEDFIAWTPSSNDEIYPEINETVSRSFRQSDLDEVFFKYKSNKRKVKNTFAICYQGQLFFQNGQIIKRQNRSEADQDQTTHDINAFVRVRQGGDFFLYTETELESGWGSAISNNLGNYSNLSRRKGVVWDYKKQEFNIFRNCKDLNTFLSEYYIQGMLKCFSQNYDLRDVRNIIEIIK